MKQKLVESIYKVRGNRIDHANKHEKKYLRLTAYPLELQQKLTNRATRHKALAQLVFVKCSMILTVVRLQRNDENHLFLLLAVLRIFDFKTRSPHFSVSKWGRFTSINIILILQIYFRKIFQKYIFVQDTLVNNYSDVTEVINTDEFSSGNKG